VEISLEIEMRSLLSPRGREGHRAKSTRIVGVRSSGGMPRFPSRRRGAEEAAYRPEEGVRSSEEGARISEEAPRISEEAPRIPEEGARISEEDARISEDSPRIPEEDA